MKNKIIILILIFLMMKFVSADLNTDLIYAFQFEQITGNYSDSINSSFNDTSAQVTDRAATGINDYGADFEGDNTDFINLPTMLNGWTEYTICVWVNSESFYGTFMTVFGYHLTAVGEAGVLIKNDGEFISAVLNGTEKAFTTSGLNGEVGKWYHLCSIYNGSNTSISVNGTIYGSTGVGNEVTSDGTRLGRKSGALGDWYDGIIDELYIYNRTLTTSEITSLYNSGIGFFYPFETDPPILSNPICTNCRSGSNESISKTPTINVTCTDASECKLVRIANNSALTMATATTTRNCTAGTGDVWVCTLTAADNLTVLNYPQPLYFWANDTTGNNHTIFNLTINITLVTAILKLDGLEINRIYEYETTANLTTTYTYIDILDDTFRWRNLASPVNYTLDLFRINEFYGGNLSKNITSGKTENITIDNQTDLYNATINITGFSNPRNLTLNVSGEIINFPGTLKGNNLTQDNFIYLGLPRIRVNLSFSTAGSKTIYLNFSNRGDVLNREGNYSFIITAYDLDKDNDFDFTENFSNSDHINTTTLLNTSAHMSVFDDFESVTPDRWSSVNDTTCTDTVSGFSTLDGNDGVYQISCSVHIGNIGTSSGTIKMDYDAPEITLSNISQFNISATYSYYLRTPNGGSGTANTIVYVTDGTNEIELYRNTIAQSGEQTNSQAFNVTIHGVKNSDGTWKILQNSVVKTSSISLASLNEPKSLRFKASSSVSSSEFQLSAAATSSWFIRNFNTSGLRLKRLNGTYEINVTDGCFESNTLVNTPNDIVRAFLSFTAYSTADTTINAFVSNDNGTTYETAISNTFHTFTSSGKSGKAKFCLNSTDNYTSPFILNYRFQIIPVSPSNLVIDVGDDGIIDMEINNTLNSTTTPIGYSGNDTGINNYINTTGQTASDILIPVVFILGSGGTIQISISNLIEDINPVSLNTTNLQKLNSILLNPIYIDGILQVNDVRIDYRGRKNITVVAHNGDYSVSLNRTIFGMYSPFNVTILPQSIDYWNVGPNIYETSTWIQNNIPPFGNADGNGNPFWNVTRRIWDRPIDIYVKWNESVNTCQTTWFNGINQSDGSTLPVTINTSAQLIVDQLEGTQANISTFTNISCAAYNSTLLFPYLCWFSIDSEAVKTQDYDSNCEYIN